MGLNDHIAGGNKPHERRAFEPTAFGDYLLLDREYADRLSEVFTAKGFGDVGSGLLVAVKRFAPFFAEADPEVGEFLDLLRHLEDLDHPNICRTIDSGFVDGHIFTAMEHTLGIDLSTIIAAVPRGRPVPWPIALCIVIAVLRALHAAHAKETVHKSISPSRIRVGRDGTVKVKGFSHAKTFHWILT